MVIIYKGKQFAFMPQRIIFPWDNTKTWPINKERLNGPLNTTVEYNSMLVALHRSATPRAIADSLSSYFRDVTNKPVTEEEFLHGLLPAIRELVLAGPKLFKKRPLYILDGDSNTSLTRLQVACIMACGMFGFMRSGWLSEGKVRSKRKKQNSESAKYNENDFAEFTFMYGLESSNVTFKNAMLAYWKKTVDLYKNNKESLERRIIIYKRRTYTGACQWHTYNIPLRDIRVETGHAIESKTKMHFVSSTPILGSERIFGGMLTQDESALLARPELIPLVLLSPALDDNTVVLGFGAERMINVKGFSSSLQYDSMYEDLTTVGDNGKEALLQCAVVFADPTDDTTTKSQCFINFSRDLHKAYVAMSSLHVACDISSNAWTYGMNPGNRYVKIIQQIAAAAFAGKNLCYHFNNRDFDEELIPFIEWLQNSDVTIMELLRAYATTVKDLNDEGTRIGDLNLFQEIMDMVD